MRERRFIGLKIVALAVLLSASGRLATGQDQSKKQSEWEAKAVAQMSEETRRKYERLKHPTFAQLELLPELLESSGGPEERSKPYKTDDRIFFRLIITNMSSEDISFSIADPYYYDRPQLRMDGEVVPYRNGLVDLLKAKERNPWNQSVRPTTLHPHDQGTLNIEMEQWYEPLQPGRYMLTIKRRFIWGGEWIESPSLMFDVVPK